MTVNTATPTDEVDTSTNEETPDTESDLENMDVSFDSEEDTTESEDGEETEESSESDEDESANESEEEQQEESKEDETDKEETESEDPDAKRREAARAAFEKREAARKAREQAKAEAQQKYINEAENSQDTALRQLQVNAYNLQIQTNQNTLQNDLDKAVAHIDLLTSKDLVVREEMLQAVDDFEANHVLKDKNGDPVQVDGNLFDHLQRKAESIRKLTGIREQKRQQDKSNLKARTTTVPSRTPKQAKVDPDLEAFDEEAERY